MRIDLLNLFPEMFAGVFGQSILKRAQDKGLLELVQTNIRDFALDKHRSVDDRPYGGGSGMVMMCQPVFDAFEHVKQSGGPIDEVLIMTPTGEPFSQAMAEELAGKQRLVLIAGHYEGFDERIHEGLSTRDVSIGDYVLSGGELPAMVIVDAIARLIPGVLGDDYSNVEESFSDGLLEYPHYTRPVEYRGMTVPDVLMSGHHEAIRKWRAEQSLKRTQERRPDLLAEDDNVSDPTSR